MILFLLEKMWQPPESNAVKIPCHSSPSHRCHQMRVSSAFPWQQSEPRVTEGAQASSVAWQDQHSSPSWRP